MLSEFAPIEFHNINRDRASSILKSVSFTLLPHHSWTKRPISTERKLPALVENQTPVMQAVSELLICVICINRTHRWVWVTKIPTFR
jgi:hypothetical protein